MHLDSSPPKNMLTSSPTSKHPRNTLTSLTRGISMHLMHSLPLSAPRSRPHLHLSLPLVLLLLREQKTLKKKSKRRNPHVLHVFQQALSRVSHPLRTQRGG